MKRKKLVVASMIVLSLFIFAACGNSQTDNNESQTSSEKSSALDESLTGLDLIKSLTYSYPDSLKMTTKSTIPGTPDTVSTTYTKGDNFRMEMELGEYGKQITIYNASEGVTYQYTEGEITGISFKDAETTNSSSGVDGSPDSRQESVTSLDDLSTAFPDDVVARVETLNGEKVIYIETTETDVLNGTIDVRMWYSVRYGVPLKYEMLSNGSVTMTSEVTDISADTIADSQFIPPSTITFTDFSAIDFSTYTDIPIE